jgi:hypothetical protein
MPVRCPHGMPTPASCVDCFYEDGVGPDPTPPVSVDRWSTAQYEGRLSCGHEVALGDRIGSTEDGWVCGPCGGDRP